MRKKKIFSGLLAVVLLVVSSGFITHVQDDYFEVSKNLEIFGKLYREIHSLYVDKTNPSLLMRTGIDAMLGSLDPYTNFIDEGQAEDVEFLFTGQYAGVGLAVEQFGGRIVVTDIVKGLPANRAGLKVGDEVIRINQTMMNGLSQPLDSIRQLIRSPQGAVLDMEVSRPGTPAILKLKINREWVKLANVPYFGFADDATGYVVLSGFTQGAADEVRTAIETLKAMKPGLRGLVLDLRNNPGGRLDEAVKVVNLFVPAQETVVETRGRLEGTHQAYLTQRAAVLPDLPLVVLVNGQSASAAEIVAGAIQDMDRGLIAGSRSFGKGLVQTVRPLTYNTQIKITTAKYYTPSGRCIQAIEYLNGQEAKNYTADSLKGKYFTRNGRTVYGGGGIMPDLEVEDVTIAQILQALNNQHLIFEFAVKFLSENASKSIDPEKFVVTDAVYADFQAFLKKKQFDYRTEVDQQLTALRAVAEEEAYLPVLASELNQMESTLKSFRKADLAKSKKEIARVLRLEIVRQAHFQEGAFAASLTDDPLILKALAALANGDQYKKLLTPAP